MTHSLKTTKSRYSSVLNVAKPRAKSAFHFASLALTSSTSSERLTPAALEAVPPALESDTHALLVLPSELDSRAVTLVDAEAGGAGGEEGAAAPPRILLLLPPPPPRLASVTRTACTELHDRTAQVHTSATNRNASLDIVQLKVLFLFVFKYR